jgi:adenine-specific DNA-methyltransferase
MPDSGVLREDYMLHYMLDVESRDSLLTLERFAEPFHYQLKVATGIVGETKPTTVDLVETFNYLLGLHVQRLATIEGVRLVKGVDPSGVRIVVLWRSIGAMPNDRLNKFFQTQDVREFCKEFDVLYVNGDNNLEVMRPEREVWQVRLTDREFKARMFP